MKLLRFHTALALTVASAFVFTACGGDDPPRRAPMSKRVGGTVPSPGGVEPETHPIRTPYMTSDMHDTKTWWLRHIGHTA